MIRWILGVTAIFGLFLIFPSAQTEHAIKQYFEGRTVVVKMDMPGSSDGVDMDVFPGGGSRVNYNSYGQRLKAYGVALKDGDSVTVTKIKVKGKHIEFQLGGGGYGTFGDDTNPTVLFTPTPKSTRERDLEKELDKETDARRRRQLQNDLDDVRWRREREDERLRREALAATELKAERIRQNRIQGGSRINLNYGAAIPPEELTSERMMAALETCLIFPWIETRPAEPAAAGPAGSGAVVLRKGMSFEEVVALLGAPAYTDTRPEGSLRILHCDFEKNGSKASTDFLEGVLIRFSIQSN